MEIVSRLEHNVLYSWLNLGMENWFAIRSYQLVGRSIMVLMGTSIVKIWLRLQLLLRMLECQIGLRVIVNVNMLMR